MALSVGAVTKLILAKIGGSPVLGNPSNVDIGGKIAIVKSVDGNLKQAVDKAISSGENLLKNPISKSLNSLKDNIDMSANLVTSSSIPSEYKTALNTSLTNFKNVVDNHIQHTNIISGIDINYETIGENQLSFHEISNYGTVAIQSLDMKKDDILKTMSAITNTDNVDSSLKSLDSSIPGGTSDILHKINTVDPSDTETISNLTDQFNSELNIMSQNLIDQKTNDLTHQLELKAKIDKLNEITTLIPNNEFQKEIIGIVGSDTLKSII